MSSTVLHCHEVLRSQQNQALIAPSKWDNSFTWALKDMQIVADLTDKAGLSLPITGAIKELVKDARRIKATNAPKWTGPRDGHDKSIAETPPSTNRLAP
jgi:hypothetical protein